MDMEADTAAVITVEQGAHLDVYPVDVEWTGGL